MILDTVTKAWDEKKMTVSTMICSIDSELCGWKNRAAVLVEDISKTGKPHEIRPRAFL